MDFTAEFASIKAAIDKSVAATSDVAWIDAVEKAGLVSKGDVGDVPQTDETYVTSAEEYELRVRHTCRDTSKSFQMRPDRTTIKVELLKGGKVIETYANGYDS